MKRTVHVEIFKPTGKWYAMGDYVTQEVAMFEIFDEVGQLALNGNIPGLVDGASWTTEPRKADWVLVVTCPEHEHDHPHMIPLFRDSDGKRTLTSPLE